MGVTSRLATESRYRDIRHLALMRAAELTQSAIAPTPVSLTDIGPTALAAFNDQWVHSVRRYPWPWPLMVADVHRQTPTRFEVAVWSDQTLSGLALGRIRDSFCGIEYLEGCPDPDHPLRGHVTVIVLTAAVAYAKSLGKRELRLIDPIPAMVSRYVSHGFQLAMPRGESPYCWRNIT